MNKVELARIMPAAGRWLDVFLQPLNDTMARYEIDSPLRQAAFLAQVGHESQQLNRRVENLRYSAQGLLRTWPKRFTNLKFAQGYEKRPEAIANYVYASRMGNGPVASGDGWKYRGRGLIMITGRYGYRDCGVGIDLPLEDHPELLEEPESAALSAGWFWDRANLNRYADRSDMDAMTLLINGGRTGLAERLALYDRAIEALA